MKRFKKPKSKKPTVTITRADRKRMCEDITWKALTLFVAVCMDEFDWDEDQVEAFGERCKRYMAAVDDHLLSIKKVQEIIKDTIGLTFEGW